jgi:hypothetical protein
LAALDADAVSRPDGTVEMRLRGTAHVLGRCRRTEFQSWLEARVVLELCEACAVAASLGEPCDVCAGEGAYLVPAEAADVDLRVVADNAADQATDTLRDRVAP